MLVTQAEWEATSDSVGKYALLEKLTLAQKQAWVYDPLEKSSPILTSAFKCRKRVEIIYKTGDVERGRIGRSTGWAPTYIVIKTRRSRGGHSITEQEVASIRVIDRLL